MPAIVERSTVQTMEQTDALTDARPLHNKACSVCCVGSVDEWYPSVLTYFSWKFDELSIFAIFAGSCSLPSVL